MDTKWLFFLAFFALLGCSQGENAPDANNDLSYVYEHSAATDGYETGKTEAGFAPAEEVADQPTTTQAPTPVKMPDKIIKTGNMGIEVSDYHKAMALIADKVKAAQGYISHQNEQRTDYQISNSLTIRVVSQNFDLLINGIGETAHKLNYKNVYMQDVSEEYTDVAARLKTKREVELRYLDILKTAKTIKDILAVEDQLRTIREEIESAEARLKFMDDRVSYSTIMLELSQPLDYNAPAPLQAGFGHKLLGALTAGWNGILTLIIGMVRIWPLLLVGTVAFALVLRKWRARKAA